MVDKVDEEEKKEWLKFLEENPEIKKELQEVERLQELMDDPGIPDYEAMQAEEEQQKVKEYLDIQLQQTKREKKEKEILTKTQTDIEKKKLEEKAEEIEKYSIYSKWKWLFSQVSFNNEVFGQTLLHVLIGQMLSHHRILLEAGEWLDFRVNVFAIQDAGSGKGTGLSFLRKVVKHLKKTIRVETPTGDKDATISLKMNKATGSMTESHLLNDWKKIKGKYVEEVKEGLVTQSDIVFYEEARILVQPGKFNENLQDIWITIMEPIGSDKNLYNKGLLEYDNPCPTKGTCSLVATTRPLEGIKSYILYTGLPQRTLFIPRQLSSEERKEMNKKSSLSSIRGEDSKFDGEFNNLVRDLQRVCNKAWVNYIEVKPQDRDEIVGMLNNKIEEFTNFVIENVNQPELKNILHDFVSRYRNHMIVLMHHAAVLREDNKIKKEDVEYASGFLKRCFHFLVSWLETTLIEDKDVKERDKERKYYISQFLKQNNNITTRRELIKYLSKKINRAEVSCYRIICNFSEGKNSLLTTNGDFVSLRKDV
tara:strand:+ start:32269 stop:33876 length:1608 start_codon:yes stop_codon:yes gene_type:complete